MALSAKRKAPRAKRLMYNTIGLQEHMISGTAMNYEVRYRATTHGMRGSDRGTVAPQKLRRGGGAVQYIIMPK